MALGCLGWKPDDFNRYTTKDLLKAAKGRTKYLEQQWEMVRFSAYYSIAPHVKKGFSIKDIKLPHDVPEVLGKVGKRIKLDRNGLIEEYRKAGIEISKDVLERLIPVKAEA